MCGPKKMKITEAELEVALDSRSDRPIYRILKEARTDWDRISLPLWSETASAIS